jgi:cytochrome c biogenesis protein CcmG/thiol:disulfide interchange protein DsbE
VILYGVDYKESLYGKTDRERAASLTSSAIPFQRSTGREGLVRIDWGVTGVPETFVIDGKGVIRVHYAGPLNEETLRRLILPP